MAISFRNDFRAVALLLILFTNEKNKAKMDLNIQEITYINHYH
jgi:hypothetical protein